MKQYFLEKISGINYRMATHEGDANRRLASESRKILLLPVNILPPDYETKLLELKTLITTTIKEMHMEGMTPFKIKHIRNKTAVKYIKMLIEMENQMKE